MLKVNKKYINPEIVIAVVLAIAPILQHYKGLYENAGFTAILIAAAFLFYKLFYALKQVVETKTLTNPFGRKGFICSCMAGNPDIFLPIAGYILFCPRALTLTHNSFIIFLS